MDFLTFEGDEVPWWWPGFVWSHQSVEHVSFEEALDDVRLLIPEPSIPLLFGITAAAAPFVAGAAIVAFAPPWLKPVGASMLVPTGVGEAFWFGVGYGVGQQVEDWF